MIVIPISYLESSFLSAHAGFTERATLERSVRGAVLIGCWKTMQITGSNSETQYGGQKHLEGLLSSLVLIWQWMRLKVSCCGPRAWKGSILLQLERLTRFQCDNDKRWKVIEGILKYAGSATTRFWSCSATQQQALIRLKNCKSTLKAKFTFR